MKSKAREDQAQRAQSDALRGKVALIIDSADQSGTALAVDLALRGAQIALVHQAPLEPHVAQAKREIEASGGQCLLLPADEYAHSPQIVPSVIEQFGHLDIFIDYSDYGSETAVLVTPDFLEENNNKPNRDNGQRPRAQAILFPGLELLTAAMNEILIPTDTESQAEE